MTVDNPSDVNDAVQDATPTKRPQRIDIGDGLLMRWSTQADAENIAGCLAEVFKVYAHTFSNFIYDPKKNPPL